MSPSPSVLSHRETPQDSFLPPIPQGPMVQMKRPTFSGTSKNFPMPIERLPAINSAGRSPKIKDGQETGSSKKHRLAGNAETSEASNHFPCCCCCCNGCTCGRKASFGMIRRRSLVTSPLTTQRQSPTALAIRIKDSYRFSSVAGTPTTAYRHLAELDKWMDNRPKTTPPLDNIALSYKLRNNNHQPSNPYNHYKNHILGKSVQEVGSRNQKLTRGPSPGAIVAAGIKGL